MSDPAPPPAGSKVTDPKLATPENRGTETRKPKPKPELVSPYKTVPNPDDEPKNPEQKPAEGSNKTPSGSLKIKPPNKK